MQIRQEMCWLFAIILCVIFLSSCANSVYIGKLALGEARILWGSIPIEQALEEEDLRHEEREKLKLVQEVREFARDKIGLNLDGSYGHFYRVRGDTLIYLVTACPKDSLDAHTWRFPIVGEVEYKGFFDKEDALKEVVRLEKKGLDTFLQGAVAFSTLGWLNDPVYSTILDHHPVLVIEIIIHELVHNTIFVKGETEFNERVASFISREGTGLFIEEHFGPTSAYQSFARDFNGDEEIVTGFIQDLYHRLTALYDQDVSREEKLKKREEIFAEAQMRFSTLQGKLRTGYFRHLALVKFNNALVVAHKRYLNPPDSLLCQVYDALDRDLRGFVELLHRLPKTKESPAAYLRQWLQRRTNPGDSLSSSFPVPLPPAAHLPNMRRLLFQADPLLLSAESL